ncbi:acyl-CoA dehydrogenase family protein [Rhizorhabdus wittichii]|uniref:acyl-CoA dehydrogenase family protein n=1 Tax=Rhizorhabdus wittichii TaxID=160791 RepID=UPI0002F95D4C|nr:acyl-CoA dehydrogenase family protein [Rhizorhabdus wittichii]
MTDEVEQARIWFRENWNPELTLGEWWSRLARSGYGFPSWPREWFGRGLSKDEGRAIHAARKEAGAFRAPHGIATQMVALSLMEIGTTHQRDRYIPKIVTGEEIWCQLFSEPGAGSDLASVRTRAELRDGRWIVNGQKVWTSGASYADKGILLARTDVSVPKHKGMSFFILDMKQPGVEVRPLRQMNGMAEFFEVFFTDAEISAKDMIGSPGDGWSVAMRMLGHERQSLDADADSTGGLMAELPLSTRVGDLVVDGGEAENVDPAGVSVGAKARAEIIELIQWAGCGDDPVVRQKAAELFMLIDIARFAGRDIDPSLSKLAATRIMEKYRSVSLSILGADAMLIGPDTPFGGRFQEMALTMTGLTIAGGTDQIQRNIVGERLLGLPAEPRVDKDIPFRDLLASGGGRAQ